MARVNTTKLVAERILTFRWAECKFFTIFLAPFDFHQKGFSTMADFCSATFYSRG